MSARSFFGRGNRHHRVSCKYRVPKEEGDETIMYKRWPQSVQANCFMALWKLNYVLYLGDCNSATVFVFAFFVLHHFARALAQMLDLRNKCALPYMFTKKMNPVCKYFCRQVASKSWLGLGPIVELKE